MSARTIQEAYDQAEAEVVRLNAVIEKAREELVWEFASRFHDASKGQELAKAACPSLFEKERP